MTSTGGMPALMSALLFAYAPALLAQGLSPSAVFKYSSPSVVVVKAYDERDKLMAFGSGVAIADNVVATNCHVLSSAGSQYAEVEYQGKNLPAELREADTERDLCTLDVKGLPAPLAAIASSQNLEVGSKVYAIGAPEGYKLTLSDGLVSGRRTIDGINLIQVTAPISRGSSGGGLFDDQGRLIGITTSTDGSGQSLNFAIPAEWIADLPSRTTYRPQDYEHMRSTSPAMPPASAAQAAEAATVPSEVTPASRWLVVYQNDRADYFVDSKTAKRTGSIVTAWVKVTYASPTPYEGGKEYVEMLRLGTFYCGSRQSSYTKIFLFDARGGVVDSQDYEDPTIMKNDIVPDTGNEAAYETFCS